MILVQSHCTITIPASRKIYTRLFSAARGNQNRPLWQSAAARGKQKSPRDFSKIYVGTQQERRSARPSYCGLSLRSVPWTLTSKTSPSLSSSSTGSTMGTIWSLT